jgi:hypothetical protein
MSTIPPADLRALASLAARHHEREAIDAMIVNNTPARIHHARLAVRFTAQRNARAA